MNTWLQVLTLDLAVAAGAAVVLILDAIGTVSGRALGWLTAGLLAAVLGASFVVDVSGTVPHGVYVSGDWVLFFKRVFLIAGMLAVLGSIDWLAERTPRRQAEYYALTLFSLTGMMVVPGARDWVLLLVAFELMGIPLYVLAAWAKTDGQPQDEKLGPEAGLKLFVTGAASSAFTIFGLGLVIGETGSTAISALPAQPTQLTFVGMLMVIAGLGFKLGAVPFHMWVPDTYQGAPTPFVAFLSVAPKAGGLAALSVVTLTGWSAHQGLWATAIAVIAAASMLVGNLFALPQTDVRRLLGFSGVAQIGYVLIALGAGSQEGVAMALFFIATYVFTNLGAFLVVHAAAQASGGHETVKLAGLSRRTPWLGASLLVFLLSLAGIPFVLGFWAKLFVFVAAWRAGLSGLVVLGVVVAVLGLFYYLTVARSTFMAEGHTAEPVRAPMGLKVSIAVCLAAVVGLGLWPRPLVDEANKAASSFLQKR
ncbi:MAG: NADH-quinone oxidoreductase subunit N [Myxococcaceae bacterium]|nr:NADH-quinone oxidoreductase subunit N [Myxococcaceae bacterium]